MAEVKKILDDALRERQEGIQGPWQQESPTRFWSKSVEMRIWDVASKSCGKATLQ